MFKLVKLTTFAAVALSFFGFSFANADPNQVYLENGGYIHFEVEDADPAGQWSLRNEIEGFTGTGYFEWTGPNHFLQANAGNGTITYHFRIETAGNYELRWRSRIAKGDENTESNDSWVRFNTGINVTDEEPLSGWTKVFMGESNIWTWSARTSDHGSRRVRQYFSQGDHTLQISGRSNGHAIDKIALYRYGDVNFDAGLNGVLPLSQFIRLDGTLVDPNAAIANSVEPVDPVTGTAPETENSNAGSTPETDNPNGESAPGTENTSGSSVPESVNSTGDSTPDTENTIATPEPDTTLSEQLNVQPLAEEFEQLDTAVCQVNTVTLLPSKYALLNLGEQSFVTDITDLQLIPDTQSLLLSYDLSQLPVFSAAQIQYQTGSNISNGALSVHLGSHNNWTDTSTEDFPVAIVNTADAFGGWDAESRYATTLDASLLPRDGTTLILSLLTNSDELVVGNTDSTANMPRLSISGDSHFCAQWEANLAQNKSVTSDNTISTDSKKSGFGSVGIWMMLLLIAGFSFKRNR